MEATVIRGEKLSDGLPNVRRAYIPNPPAINMAFGEVKVKGGLKEGKGALTRVAVRGTFLSLTNERVNTMSG